MIEHKPRHFIGSILQQAFDKTCEDHKLSTEDRQKNYATMKEGLQKYGYPIELWPDVYPEEVK